VGALGSIRARYDYELFGQRSKVSGDIDVDFGFTGHYFHEKSGLVLAPFRSYAPDLDRWLSEDPVGGAYASRYGYVGNGVVSSIDPLGLYKRKQLPGPVKWTENTDLSTPDLCGENAGGGCTRVGGTFVGVTANCLGECPGAGAYDVTLFYGVSLVLYLGDFNDLKTGPHDKSIRNVFDVLSHEFNAHVYPALDSIDAMIHDFENSTFDDVEDCERALIELNRDVGDRFHSELTRTQTRERSFR